MISESRDETARSITAAVQFLKTTCNRHGYWLDYDSTIGPSTEWVTGYVASSLASVSDPGARQLTVGAWEWLRRQRWWHAGWGFAPPAPPDADSTHWALHVAEAVGASATWRARRAYRFLSSHIRPDGGLATFVRIGPIRMFTGVLLPTVSFKGWCSSHPDVSAAAVTLDGIVGKEALVAYLQRTQTPEGFWRAYWWRDREYATAFAVQALAPLSDHGVKRQVQAAVDWTCSRFDSEHKVPTRIHPNGSPFATALGVMTLIAAGNHPKNRRLIDGAVGWLRQIQRHDGSWDPSATMRIPSPNMIDPDAYQRWTLGELVGGGFIVLDQNANFTTATALRALAMSGATYS